MAGALKFADNHNIVGHLPEPPPIHNDFTSLIVGLNACSITHAVNANPLITRELIIGFWENAQFNKDGANGAGTLESNVRGTHVVISEQSIRRVLRFGDQPTFPTDFSIEKVREALHLMSYEGQYPPTIKKLLPPFWRLLAHIFMHCVSGRKGGFDEISHSISCAIVALVMDWDFNFSKYVFDEMKGNLGAKKKAVFLMYPRFIQMILDEDYPMIERTGEMLDIKALNPSTFGLMKQSKASRTGSFQGLRPLQKLGRFAERPANQNIPVPPSTQAQNTEQTIPVPPEGQSQAAEQTTLVPPKIHAGSSSIPDETADEPDQKVFIPPPPPRSQPIRQCCIEELIDISDDEASDKEDQETEPLITEQDFNAIIVSSVPEATEEEIANEGAIQNVLAEDQSIFEDLEDLDDFPSLTPRKRRCTDQEENVSIEPITDMPSPTGTEPIDDVASPAPTEPLTEE